ncbi:MAG: multidrug RND transporter, partial [Methanobacteriota archaeon]
MRDRILQKLAEWQLSRTRFVMVAFILLTVIMGYFASQLKTTMRWSDLLPEDDPRVQEFDHVIKEFSTASSIVIILQGENHQIKQFAEELEPLIKKISHEKTGEPLIKRVDYKEDVNFIKNHALLLTKKSDLENIREIFTSPNVPEVLQNINASLEKEYVGKGESISGREKRDRAIRFLDGLKDWLKSLDRFISGEISDPELIQKGIDELLIGDPYFVSYDGNALILNVVPTFSSIELDKVIYTVNKVEELVRKENKKYQNVKVGLTGTLTLSRDEMVASQESLNFTSIISLTGIFILLALSFRMWIAPILALITLIVGTLWATGVAFISVGILNIMTSMMAVILFGLGIDF